MPTLQEVRTKVDTWLTARWPTVVSRQDTYFIANGRYWQGLKTHVAHLEYDDNTDAESQGDNLDSSPTDQTKNWQDAFPILSTLTLPALFIVDVYENNDGHGWVLTAYVRFNGTIYARAQNGSGSETNRTYAWRVYVPPEPLGE